MGNAGSGHEDTRDTLYEMPRIKFSTSYIPTMQN